MLHVAGAHQPHTYAVAVHEEHGGELAVVDEGASRALLQVMGFDGAAAVADHVEAAAAGRLPERPAGHFTVTTAHDPLQASPGPYGPLHTLRYETVAPYDHPEGAWDRQRAGYRTRCWEFLGRHTTGLDEARSLIEELRRAGVDYDDVVETLEREGVEKFSDSFRELLDGIRAKLEVVLAR